MERILGCTIVRVYSRGGDSKCCSVKAARTVDEKEGEEVGTLSGHIIHFISPIRIRNTADSLCITDAAK